MKVLSIIFAFVLTIAGITLTIWQIAMQSPTFIIIMFFAMSFMAFAILCECFAEYYKDKK